jgi:chemotaxis protein CheY-P-specific phosphatase CheC
MQARDRENFLVNVMNKGFDRAAKSFSKLINRKVSIENIRSLLIFHDHNLFSVPKEQGELHMLITQVIGAMEGKSFLIFNDTESKEVFRSLGQPLCSSSFNEAILLEIDNIISASVISELANALRLQIYGASPQLTKLQAEELPSFMAKEVKDERASSMVFCTATFQFDEQESVHPQFIWKFSNRIFEMIPQGITA